MNKDELLKIYSAYLPYDLEFEAFGRRGKINEIQLKPDFVLGLDIDSHVRHFYPDSGLPILYDLSYLTKPIEGGVYVINEIADVISKDQSFSIIQSDDAIILDFDEEYVFHIISMKNMMRQPYEIIQILLKYHFNVFDIPEDQFINKATLTQKQ